MLFNLRSMDFCSCVVRPLETGINRTVMLFIIWKEGIQIVNPHRRPPKMLFFVLAAALGLLVAGCDRINLRNDPEIQTNLAVETQIAKALAEIPNSQTKADIIDGAETLEPKISLIFTGDPTEPVLSALISLLDEYQISASFFLSDTYMTQYPGISPVIAKKGYNLGLIIFPEITFYEKISDNEIVRSIKASQQTLREQTGLVQNQLIFNSDYAKDSLITIKACGIDALIYPTHTPSAGDLATKEKAAAYVEMIPMGSVVSIPIGEESATYINDSQLEPGSANPIITSIQWLIEEFLKEGVDFIDPQYIESLTTPQVDISFLPEDYDETEQAEVFTSVKNTADSVTLSFSHLGDKQTITDLLDTLGTLNIKATFFITGREVLQYRDTIALIAAKGHSIENAGYSGANTRLMSHEEVYLEIENGRLLIEEELGFSPKYYQPEGGFVNKTIREAAYYADVPIVSPNKYLQNNPNLTAEELVAQAGSHFEPGDVIAVEISSTNRINDLVRAIAAAVKKDRLTFLTVSALIDTVLKRSSLQEIEGWDRIAVNMDFDPDSAVTGKYFEKISTEEPVVFLAFYDWGNQETITAILDLLQRFDIQASFFVHGMDAEQDPLLVQKINDNGHDSCNSTYQKDTNAVALTNEELQQDLVQSYQAIAIAIGEAPKPYYLSSVLKRNKQTINTILATGIEAIIDLGSKVPTAGLSIEKVYRNLSNFENNGQIICLPLSGGETESEFLQKIIVELQGKGFEFQKLSDYIG